MTRTIAVSEMMDQLYLFGQQNAQLRIVQEQLTVRALSSTRAALATCL